MGKYDGLHNHLRRLKADTCEMSFADIELKLCRLLPKASQAPEWWSRQPSDHRRDAHVRAWRDAGFAAALVGWERVRFSRVSAAGD